MTRPFKNLTPGNKMTEISIYGRADCPFCVKAVTLSKAKGYDYTFFNIIENNLTMDDLKKIIGRDVSTVPQIYKDKDYIGGYSEFEKTEIDSNS
ncbi:glutaredoxin domain-containing protein [Dasania marina]|uniref:glutaredoxin domain-containing protein n=1 Tax=Dasania marina TaxID=471499 RepID=UPI0030D79086|tara:strand:- start:53710 stop:53991 length:282 start_codon:yes stop_codon:yes gene_type:complete